MKHFILTVLFTLSGLQSLANSDLRVSFKPEETSPVKAGKIFYRFDLFDEKTKTFINDQDLVESHTKKLHLIAYDASLNQFNHVHPSYNGSTWSAELTLPVNGTYFIWAQGQLADGTEFSSSVQTQIKEGLAELPKTPLGDHRKASNLGTVVELAPTKARAGKMVMINFQVSREDGTSPEISPYLGAFAHVIAVSPSGNELIHVHPMEGDTPNSGMLHATFPTSGDYRIWIQLNDKGELKTIPLSISVL